MVLNKYLVSVLLLLFAFTSFTIAFPQEFVEKCHNSHGHLISWGQSKVEKTLHQGESATITVSFSSSQKLKNIDFCIAPKHKKFITIIPKHIDKVLPNVSTSIQLVVNVPSKTRLGVYCESLHIREKKKTLATPLKIKLEVIKLIAPSTALSYIEGYVYDSRTGNPLADAKISAYGVNGSVYSDANGKYVSYITYPGTISLTIEKEGYTFAQRKVTVISGLDTAVDPAYLTQLDNQVTRITSSGGIAKNSTGSIELKFPRGAVSTGTSFVITQCEKSKELPSSLPPLSQFTYASYFDALGQPEGITFDQPVEVKIANSLGFAPGTPIPVGSYNKNTLQWENECMAYVTSDGKWVKFNTTHFSAKDINLPVKLKPKAKPPRVKQKGKSPNQDKKKKVKDPAIDIESGVLNIEHAIPAYRSLGVSRSQTLVYDSSSANPNAAIYTHTFFDTGFTIVPETVGFNIKVQGIDKNVKFLGSADNTKQGYIFDGVNGREEKLSTGCYPYHINLSHDYKMNYATADYFGGPPISDTGVQSAELVSLLTEVEGFFTINNQQNSPFGAGWTLSGLQRLYPSSYGSIVLAEGDGGTTIYSPNGGFESGSLFGFTLQADNPATQGDAGLVKELGPITPPEGQYMLLLGTSGKTDTAMTSTLTTGGILIPAGVTTLNLKFNLVSEAYTEFIGYNDTFTAKLTSPSGTQSTVLASLNNSSMSPISGIDFPSGDSTTGSTGWLTGSLNVSQYAGTGVPVMLTFEMKVLDKGGKNYDSIVLIDDIKFAGNNALPIYFPSLGDYSVFAKNADGTYKRVCKDGTSFNFNANGLLTTVVDKNGNTTRYVYDTDGKILSITDPVGLVTTFTYSGNHICSVKDPTGRVTYFSINAAGDLGQIINPDSTTRTFTYDSTHLLTSETDAKGNSITYTYSDLFRVEKIDFPTGEVVSFQPSEIDGIINRLPAGIGTPENPAPAVPIPYNSITDGKGFINQYMTNEFGALTECKDPLNRVTITNRDKDNNPKSFIDPNGSETVVSYDYRGNLLSVSNYMPGISTPEMTSYVTYEPLFNQVKTTTDPKGNISKTNYDSKGNPVEFIDPQGNVLTLAYDSRGLLASATDSLQNTTLYSHNSKENLISITNPLGHSTSIDYDAAGNPISTTNVEGRSTAYQIDIMNRLTSITDSAGSITSYSYNSNGYLDSITDANGNITRFFYNTMDLPSSIINPLGAVKTISYDANENISSFSDFNGQTTNLNYDAANQLLTKAVIGNTTVYNYDISGSLINIADNDSVFHLNYDPLRRLVSVNTLPTNSQPYTEISYTYDKNENRTSVNPMGIGPIEYSYDNLNRLVSISGSGYPIGTVSYDFDSSSRIASSSLPNGTSVNYSYDTVNQLLSLINKKDTVDISSYSYTYDKIGNRISMAELAGNNNYTYDEVNHLITATHPTTPSENFTYDAAGNRISSHISPIYIYDRGNRLSEDAKFVYSYDANGNLVRKSNKITGEVTKFTFDGENFLIKIEIFPSSISVPPSSVISYRYDGLGRRIEKNVNGNLTRYIYDNEDIIAELDANNTITALYTHGPGIDEPIAMRKGNQNFFYHKDALGSIMQITNELGNVVQTHRYDSFGNIVSSAGTIVQPYKFTGREYDPESGLYFNRARYYDSTTGRFINVDPYKGTLSDPQSQQPYAYCNNNPINYTDPRGTYKISHKIRQNYPQLGNFIDSLQGVVNSVKNLRWWIKYYGNFSDSKLTQTLHSGTGPLVDVATDFHGHTGAGCYVNGVIYINTYVATDFQNYHPGLGQTFTTEGMLYLYTESIVLHETVHYGLDVMGQNDGEKIPYQFNGSAYGQNGPIWDSYFPQNWNTWAPLRPNYR